MTEIEVSKLQPKTVHENSCTDGGPSQKLDPFDTTHLMNDLKVSAMRGGIVIVAAQGLRFAIQMGSTVVLARMLTPDDFGLIAMVTALTGFTMMFRDLGLSTATIQQRTITHRQISNLFWVNVSVSLLIAAVLLVAAPVVGWFYGDPRLNSIVRALSVPFVLGGLGMQHRSLLQRQMRFVALGVIDIIALATGVVIAIVAALYGSGYWSLVIMAIATEAVATLVTCVACNWRPGLPNYDAGTKNMLRFGGNITGFNVVNYFSRNLDNILIGRYIGAAALGFYSKAYGLLTLPLSQINEPISAIAIPTLSRLVGDPKRYRRYYLKTIRLIALVTAPPIAFSIFFSDDIICIVLGVQWRPTATIYSILGLSAIAQPLYSTQGWLHLTTGNSIRYFRWGVIGACVFSVAFAVGVNFGAEGVAFAYTLAFLAILPFCMSYAGHSACIPLKDIAHASGWPIIWSLCTAGAIKLMANTFVTTWSPFPRVAIAVIAETALTLIWIARISPDLHHQVRQFVANRNTSGRSV